MLCSRNFLFSFRLVYRHNRCNHDIGLIIRLVCAKKKHRQIGDTVHDDLRLGVLPKIGSKPNPLWWTIGQGGIVHRILDRPKSGIRRADAAAVSLISSSETASS